MKLSEQNLLFFTRTMKLGGTENVVIQLCKIFKDKVNKIVVCSCGGVNVSVLNSLGVTHYEIPDIESKSPKVIMKVCGTLKKIIKDEKITIIHTHHRMAAFYVYLNRLYKKCVFINTSHNTFQDKKIFTKMAFSHANLITCGEMVKKNLIDYFQIKDSKVNVIHNAVEPFVDEIVKEQIIDQFHSEGNFVIGNIGRLSEQKGMEYYIKAIPQIITQYPQTKFLIIGTGEDESKLKKLVEDLEINQYVHFMGYRSDIQNLMSQLDLVVLSSLWEGLPLTPIEAFSVGKTVVATAVDGTVEIVESGKNGILVEARNVEELVNAIKELIKNKAYKEKMEKAAKQTFDSKFSFAKLAESYVNYYEEIIK